MDATLARLLDRFDVAARAAEDVLPWGCPVPAFGDPAVSRVATLGLNPSNREFVDDAGGELDAGRRRFHTLGSLGISSWADANADHVRAIRDACRTYFCRNPYDQWFRKLDYLVGGAGASFYAAHAAAEIPGGFAATLFDPVSDGGAAPVGTLAPPSAGPASGPAPTRHAACHLDLVPYATAGKWGALPAAARAALLAHGSNALAALLRDAPIELLILNGRSVVDQFEQLAEVTLSRHVMPEWALARRGGRPVAGVAYDGVVERLGGAALGRPLRVLGYNHNIQSSYGVTAAVTSAIRAWIAGAVAAPPAAAHGSMAWSKLHPAGRSSETVA